MTEYMTGIRDMTLPKYIRLRSGTYHYQRDYPKRLRHLCQTKTYTRPLGLFANNASTTEISKAAIEADEAFERQLKLITNSDPDALSATEKDKAVVEFLRKRGLNKGAYVRVAKDSAIAAQEEAEQRQMQPDQGNHADWAIPEFEDVMDKQQRGEKLTLQDSIVGDAYLSLINKQEAKPKTLGSLWPEYAKYKGIDVTTRDGKRNHSYWKRWIELAGDVIIGPLTPAHIDDGIESYVNLREGKIKSSSIQRELSTIMAVLNRASKKHRFKWQIEKADVKETPSNSRHPLEPHHQLELVQAVLTQQIKPENGVIILLCLQGGMMVTEIKRLKPEDIALDAVVPHLKIVNETKNKARKRIVPVVLGLELIREYLGQTIHWLNKVTETGPSYAVTKAMRDTIDSPYTSPHCLRHTFKINGQNAGVSVLTLASIFGWTDPQRRVPKHLLNYGSTGISKDATVIKLRDDSMIIHNELIALEASLRADSNVLAFAAQGS